MILRDVVLVCVCVLCVHANVAEAGTEVSSVCFAFGFSLDSQFRAAMFDACRAIQSSVQMIGRLHGVQVIRHIL